MRIAQVAPLYESVPPKFYGGTERVVSYLTEELVRQGHEVTLFASGDSITSAELVPMCPRALRLDEHCVDRQAHHFVMLDRVFEEAPRFDILHFHIDYLHFPLSKRQPRPTLTTMHYRLDIPDLIPLYEQYPTLPVVSISNSQRVPLPGANWQGTVYHGLPDDLYSYRDSHGGYLAFLGRISPDKGVDHAIQIAQRADVPIKIAAKIEPIDQPYFDEKVKPLLADRRVEYLGEISESEKNDFLGNASALILPLHWPEPFGLVMIEAMACGTPVIAFDHGSVPEVVDEGITGFVVENDNVDEAAKAVSKLSTLSRERCRKVFEERFSASRMARSYVEIYERLMQRSNPVKSRPTSTPTRPASDPPQ